MGIGTTNPQETLHVEGTIRVVDGNEQKDAILVSDVNGTGTWTNVNDGVRTRIIRSIGTIDPTLWTHPAGIIVSFDTGTETVTVTNATGDLIHFWDIVIEGDSSSTSGSTGTDKYIKNYRVQGQSLSIDLGNINSGWFRITATDQNNQLDGFIINIIYYGQDFNGMVQYWDN